VTDELLVNAMPGEIRAAMVSDGLLVELFIERRRRASLVGNVYLGRVSRVIPAMDAAFVEIGIGRAGFIGADAAREDDPRNDTGPSGGADSATGEFERRNGDRIADYLTEGQIIIVQVVKDAIGGKGAQLTRRVALPGRCLVLTPARNRIAVSRQILDAAEQDRLSALMRDIAAPEEGFILRTASAGAAEDELRRDAEFLRMAWVDIEASRDQRKAPALLHGELDPLLRIFRDHVRGTMAAIRIDDRQSCADARDFCARFMPGIADLIRHHDDPEPIFALHDIDDEIERAGQPRIGLESGGSVVIETTEALTAVDVNSGSFTGASTIADTALHTNLEAAAEITRQIRLRNIGGLIVIDCIHMDEDNHWRRVLDALESGLAGDRTHSRVIGLTGAGLVEITRRRRRQSLAQTLTEPCAACAGTGLVSSPETVALDIMRALRRAARGAAPGGLNVTAAADVIDALEDDLTAPYQSLVSTLGRQVSLRRAPEYGRENFDIVIG
jgi:ribonuclease G